MFLLLPWLLPSPPLSLWNRMWLDDQRKKFLPQSTVFFPAKLCSLDPFLSWRVLLKCVFSLELLYLGGWGRNWFPASRKALGDGMWIKKEQFLKEKPGRREGKSSKGKTGGHQIYFLSIYFVNSQLISYGSVFERHFGRQFASFFFGIYWSFQPVPTQGAMSLQGQ